MNKLSVRGKAAASRANDWVNSSFSDLVGESCSLPGQTKGLFQKPELKKARKRKVEDYHISSLLNEVVQRDLDEPWVDRYSPSSQDELAVHKKKIEEVENWMNTHSCSSKGGVLLLTGPSGCGKTATVRVLSEELGFRIQEWVNPTNTEPFSMRSQEEWKTNSMFSRPQQAQFQDFLLRANKYSCLRMRGEDGVTDKKLILVEDMPNQFYRQSSSLHDNLRLFMRTSRCPLVFIVSDSLSGDRSSRLLFPKEIQEELDITCISFNPVAPTTMMKVLTRISTQEAGKSCTKTVIPDKKVLEMLCSGSSGDIRSAINSLQFSSLPDTQSLENDLWRMQKDKPLVSKGKAFSKTNQRKKKSKNKKDEEEEQAIGGKDASLFLFRALGKILHCKRGNPDDFEGDDVSTVPVLSTHLSHHHRETLLVNPELVVERSHMSGEFFNLYLHQNYLDFFSEVEDVDRASEYLSDADLFTSNWTHRSIMEDYSSSVATRGLLHSNSQQVSVGFRPLHKPNWLLINKKHRENCLSAQSLFRNFCLTPVSLQTELLPYLAKLTNPMRNQAQITFIQDVGQMRERNYYSRTKLEALTDKEPGQLENEGEEEDKMVKEEDQGGSEEGLPASQPQPTTSQALLEEEELNIEEYDSD